MKRVTGVLCVIAVLCGGAGVVGFQRPVSPIHSRGY